MGERTLRKILLVGDPAVGKSSLVRRFVDHSYDEKYISSIGVTVKKKSLMYERPSGGQMEVSMVIYDLQGERGGKREPPYESYMRGTQGVLAVLDVTRPETSDSISKFWAPKVTEVAGEVPMYIVGNKCDLNPTANLGNTLVPAFRNLKSSNIGGILASAKSGVNVDTAFYALGRMVAPEETS